jgi:hypothetical protein
MKEYLISVGNVDSQSNGVGGGIFIIFCYEFRYFYWIYDCYA